MQDKNHYPNNSFSKLIRNQKAMCKQELLPFFTLVDLLAKF
jgi:hypothetical protein